MNIHVVSANCGGVVSLQHDLIPVNAVLGFLKRDPDWPSLLYNLGYRLELIEQPITVPTEGTVEVDLICLNRTKNHCLLWECKSGRTVDAKQAKVYSAIKPEHVQRTGNITFPRPNSAVVEVIYCCLQPDAKAVTAAIANEGLKIPLISLGAKAELASGQIKDSQVYKSFLAGVPLPPLELVPRFLTANTHTSKAELARPVFTTLVSLLRRQIAKISARQVLEETFNDWSCMGTDLRRSLLDRIKEILTDLSKNELKEFAHHERAQHSPGEFFLVFTADILGRDASSRTRTFQKFARLGEGFAERLEKNEPFEGTVDLKQDWLPGMDPNS